MRAVAGRPIIWTFELDDADGNPINADPSTIVLVDVNAGDGTPIVTAGHANDVATVGIYTYTIPAQTKLDTLFVTSTATVGGLTQTFTDQIRVIGARILSPADIRADKTLANLGSSPEGLRVLAEILDSVEDTFASALGYPAVTEGIRFNFDAHRDTFQEAYAYGDVQAAIFTGIPGLGFGFGGERLIVPGVSKPQQVYTLSINGAVAPDDVLAQFTPGNGYIIWSGGRSWPSGNYLFWMSHGMPFLPGDLRQAAARFATYIAKHTPSLGGNNSQIPERAASLATDGATIVFARAGPDAPTGVPEVDSVLFRYALESVI